MVRLGTGIRGWSVPANRKRGAVVTHAAAWCCGAGAVGPKSCEMVRCPLCPSNQAASHLVSRLMALAIRFEQLIQDGHVADYAELARLSHVSRARITQVMNLRLLAPDIQEQILFLPKIERGRDMVTFVSCNRSRWSRTGGNSGVCGGRRPARRQARQNS